MFGRKKTQRTWMNGFDQEKASIMLDIARKEFYPAGGLFNSEEVKSATEAVITTLPKKLQKHVTNDIYYDVASIILLQRAAAQYEIGLAVGAKNQQQAQEVEAVLHSFVNTVGKKEA